MRILLLTLILAGVSACSFVRFPGVYRIDVEQGNIVTQELADQLKPGMSRRQVRFILGTPLLEDTFNQDRWDYPYVKRNGLDVLSQSHLTVVFDGDSLVEIRGDYQPDWARPAENEMDLPPVPGSEEDPDTTATPRAV